MLFLRFYCNFILYVLQPSKTVVTKTLTPKGKLPLEDLMFGKTFTDHMLEINWDAENGWHDPQIVEFGNLSLSPAATCLHYGVEVTSMLTSCPVCLGSFELATPAALLLQEKLVLISFVIIFFWWVGWLLSY